MISKETIPQFDQNGSNQQESFEARQSHELLFKEFEEELNVQEIIEKDLQDLKELLGGHFSLFQESIDKNIKAQSRREKPTEYYFEKTKDLLIKKIKDMRAMLSVYKRLRGVEGTKSVSQALKNKIGDLKKLKLENFAEKEAGQFASTDEIENLLSGRYELADIKKFSERAISNFVLPITEHLKAEEQQREQEQAIAKMDLLEIVGRLADFDAQKEKPEKIELELLSTISAENELERIQYLFDEDPKDTLKVIYKQLRILKTKKELTDGEKQKIEKLEAISLAIENGLKKREETLLAESATANLLAGQVEMFWSREERMMIFEKIKQTRRQILDVLGRPEFVEFLDNEEKEKQYAENAAKSIMETQTGVDYGKALQRWGERFQEKLESIENNVRSKNVARFCRIAEKLTPAGITAGAVIGILAAFHPEALAEWKFNGQNLNLAETDNKWIVHFKTLSDVLEITSDKIEQGGNDLTTIMEKHDIQIDWVNYEIQNPVEFEAEVVKRAEKAVQELTGKTFAILGKEFIFKADSVDKISNVGELLIMVQEIVNQSHQYNFKSLEDKKESDRINKMSYDIALKNNEALVCRHIAYGYNRMLKLLIEKKLPQFSGIIADEVVMNELLPSGARGLDHGWAEVTIPLNDQEVITTGIDPTFAMIADDKGDKNWLDDLDATNAAHPTISAMILAQQESLPVLYPVAAKDWGEFGLNKAERLNIFAELLRANNEGLKGDKRLIRHLLFEYYKDNGMLQAGRHQLELADKEQQSGESARFLSRFYLKQEDFTQALQFAREGMKRAKKGSQTDSLIAQINLAEFWREAYIQTSDKVIDNSDPKNPLTYSKADLLQKSTSAFQEIIDKNQPSDENKKWLANAYHWQAENERDNDDIASARSLLDRAANLAEKNSEKIKYKVITYNDWLCDDIDDLRDKFWKTESKEQKEKIEQELDVAFQKQPQIYIQIYKENIEEIKLCENPTQKIELIWNLIDACQKNHNKNEILGYIDKNDLKELTSNQFLDLDKRTFCAAGYIQAQALAPITEIIAKLGPEAEKEAIQASIQQEITSDKMEKIAQELFDSFEQLNPLQNQHVGREELENVSYKMAAALFCLTTSSSKISAEQQKEFRTMVCKKLEPLVQEGKFARRAYEVYYIDIDDIREDITAAKKLTNQAEKIARAREILAKGLYGGWLYNFGDVYDEDNKVYKEGEVIKGLKEIGLSLTEICEKVVNQLDNDPEKALPVLLTQLRGTFAQHFIDLSTSKQKALLTKINQYAFNPENEMPYITEEVYKRIHQKEDAPRELGIPYQAEITLKELEDYVKKELTKGLSSGVADSLLTHYETEKVRVFTESLGPLIEAAKQQNQQAAFELGDKILNQFNIGLQSAVDNSEKISVLRDFIRICNKSGSYITLESISEKFDPLIKEFTKAELNVLYATMQQETTDDGKVYNNVGTHALRIRVFNQLLQRDDYDQELPPGTLKQAWEDTGVACVSAPITEIDTLRQLRVKEFYCEYLFKNFNFIKPQNQKTIEQCYSQAVQELEQRLAGSAVEESYNDYILIADYWNKQNKSIPTVKNTVARFERYILSAQLESVANNKKTCDAEVKNIEKLTKYLIASQKGEIGDFLGHLHQLKKAGIEQVGPDIERLRVFEGEIADIPANKPLKDGIRKIIELYDQRLGK